MVSDNIPSGQSEIAVIQASRQRRLEIQAARHAAFNDACFRADPDQSEPAPTRANFPIFVHDPDALAHATRPPPTLTPARILDADAATIDGQSVLVRTTWWTARCRFPRPGVDGVFAQLPQQTVMPLLEAYYGNKCEEAFVPIRSDGRIMLAAACLWSGRPAPVTTRRLFFCGSLKDPQTLGRVLKAPPGYDLGLVPAVLEGWRGLVPGAGSERVEGCTYKCAGRLIPLIEDYYGENYAPVGVTVAVSRAGGQQERVRAWCYVRDDNPAI